MAHGMGAGLRGGPYGLNLPVEMPGLCQRRPPGAGERLAENTSALPDEKNMRGPVYEMGIRCITMLQLIEI